MIVIINETFDIDIKSEMLMSIADINYILLDTRLTPENKIMECDKMKAEYGLQSLYFILNRFAYNPTIFKEIYLKIKSIKKYCAFFKKK